eukprot:COSAG01_NODE_2518_length_7524_cov_2.305724_5_plen_76_part_00
MSPCSSLTEFSLLFHSFWLRDEGRIGEPPARRLFWPLRDCGCAVDKPRGMAAMREQALRAAREAEAAAAAAVAAR